ncbi:28S ribosomal protein S5, mitochondrial [Hyalella azteca]|uniref:Small ribosomal subunit protein uS5m n=1 Tax=Hyalella azteca TaxID=294128 RepID=A0A8B7PPW4_HYAAZ|nr:28S ribosomal protein S5, mitochondrial [Hyalella azteca]
MYLITRFLPLPRLISSQTLVLSFTREGASCRQLHCQPSQGRNLFPQSGLICPPLRPLLAPTSHPQISITRHGTNFFNKLPAQKLWKGVISVSKHGAQKGRGRGAGRKLAKDLNRGQVIGVGAVNMVWPGLNAPIIRGQEVVQQQMLGPDPDRHRKLLEIRDKMGRVRFRKVNPLERGWTGTKMGGKKIGPPDPVGNDTFEGFESVVLEYKVVSHMRGDGGKFRRVSVLSVTGDGMGLAGFALARAPAPNTALSMSKNRAGQRLIKIPLYNNHTILHDFHSQSGITEVFVRKMPEGHGLVCHRALKAACEIIGIKDLHVYIKGPKNVREVVKAFFLGLMKQKSYQQLAEEKGLHVVELRKEQFNYPKVLASPVHAPLRTLSDIPPNENLDFSTYVMGDRVMLKPVEEPSSILPLLPKKGRQPEGRETFLRKYKERRNFRRALIDLITEYGDERSFLAKQYPEAWKNYGRRNWNNDSDDDE